MISAGAFSTEELDQFFRGSFSVSPHHFQLEVARHLLANENVVAVAPTGAGKTLAPVAAFTFAKEIGLPFADRLIFVLPQRTLTIALRDSVQAMLQKAGISCKVTIQTGNMPEDPFFEGDIVFTTIDQALSAYIETPVSLSPRLANIPGGALLGALIVFDEIHLLEPTVALATVLDLASQLKPFSQILLMSATLPSEALAEVVQKSKAVPVQVTPDEVEKIPSQHGKRREYVWHSEPLTARAILDDHKDKTIVVVNTVARAQDLFREVARPATERHKDTKLILLHSRFLQARRREIEEEVIRRFRKGGEGKAILIATQVVEVGLDISCDTLHTEVATASALFQRAGRCARYENESGTVHVYELEHGDKGRRYGPYRQQREIVDRVADEISRLTGKMIGFADEQGIVNEAHGGTELAQLGTVGASRRGEVVRAQQTHDPSFIRRLVRNVDSVSVLIHSDPRKLDLARQPEIFSLPRSVFWTFLKELDLTGKDAGKILYPVFAADTEGQSQPPEWLPVSDRKEMERHFVLALSPLLASYDDTFGLKLLPDEPGNYECRHMLQRADERIEKYSYHKELYSEHVARVVAEADTTMAAHSVALVRLARFVLTEQTSLIRLVRLVCKAHDSGKLANGVQDAMWRWMEEAHGDHRSGFLAHTEFDAKDPYQSRLTRMPRFRKPPHAVEGAYAAMKLISASVKEAGVQASVGNEVAVALFSAIARHHSPIASTLRDFGISPMAEQEFWRNVWPIPKIRLIDHPSEVERSRLPAVLVDPAIHQKAYPLYLLVVRLLRMADQRATARKELAW